MLFIKTFGVRRMPPAWRLVDEAGMGGCFGERGSMRDDTDLLPTITG